MSDDRAPFAVVMLTLNEELNLPEGAGVDRRARAGGDRRLGVDRPHARRSPASTAPSSSSTASTDYASQRNFALEQVEGRFRWIFFLDADEEFDAGAVGRGPADVRARRRSTAPTSARRAHARPQA
jgi:hypothetical protein